MSVVHSMVEEIELAEGRGALTPEAAAELRSTLGEALATAT